MMKAMNCVVYTRVSGESQIDNFSLDTQLDICTAFADREGYDILKVFREEGVSAKTKDRPELISLLEFCRLNRQKIAAVVAYKIDRIARQTSDYLAIKKELAGYGIKLLSTSEPTGTSPVDAFIETIFASVAQLDNSVRGERAKNGLYKRFLSGYHVSKPPIGYIASKDKDGRCVAIPSESFDLVKKSWHLMATGTKSISEMVNIMSEWGITTWKGGRIGKQTVSEIFKNKFYAGILTSKSYKESEVQGKHLPMITEEMYYRVRGIINGRLQRPIDMNKLVKNDQFPLKGLVKHTCGQNLVAANCKGGSGKYYAKYWCKDHSSPSISADDMNKEIYRLLKQIQPTQDAINLFTLILHDSYNERLQEIKKAQDEVKKKKDEIKRMLTLLVQGHLKGLYSDEIFKEQKASFEDQLLVQNIVNNDSLCDKYDIEAITNFVKALLFDLAKAYEVSDHGQKQILISSIFNGNLVYENGKLLNSSISPIFELINQSEDHASALVGVPRFELGTSASQKQRSTN